MERSPVEDIKVCIFGEVVPGGIKVTNDDEVPVELLCDGLMMYVFDAEYPPFVFGVDDLSRN